MYRNIYWQLEQFHTMSKMSLHVDSSGLQRVFRSKRPCHLESIALDSLNLCLEYVPLWYQRVAQQKQGTWQQILHINSFTPLDIYKRLRKMDRGSFDFNRLVPRFFEMPWHYLCRSYQVIILQNVFPVLWQASLLLESFALALCLCPLYCNV